MENKEGEYTGNVNCQEACIFYYLVFRGGALGAFYADTWSIWSEMLEF